MEPERMGAGRSGSSGASGGDQAAAHFSSRGFQARGSPPGVGHGAGWGFEAGKEGGARPGRPGGGGKQGPAPGPRPLKALSTRLPPPTTRWRRGQWGSPAGEAGGERGEGREAETKRRPPGTRRPAREPPAAGGQAGGPAENAAGWGSGLTFSCRSRRRRPPW